MNPRISAKERGLIKGALRRVFSRSDLRRSVLEAQAVEHSDPKRPRVKKWAYCAECGEVCPAYKMQVDHQDPIIPVKSALEHMSWDAVINNIWCSKNKLQLLCQACHTVKTKAENKARRDFKKNGTSS